MPTIFTESFVMEFECQMALCSYTRITSVMSTKVQANRRKQENCDRMDRKQDKYKAIQNMDNNHEFHNLSDTKDHDITLR